MRPLPSPWSVVFAIADAAWDVAAMVGDAVDLAAKALCPMDHTPPPNLLDDPSLYVRIPEPRLTDDELAAVRSIIADCNSKAIAEPSRAVGTQHADAPGEVQQGGPLAAEPSPGEPQPLFATSADSDLLRTAAITLRYFVECAGGSTPNTERLIAELTDRAAQFEAAESEPDAPVSQEALAARISDLCGGGVTTYDLAGALLAKFHITKK